MSHPTPETRTKREMRKMRAMSSTTPWSTLFGLATMFATATAATGCLDLIGYRDHVVGDPFGTGGGGGETGGGGTGGIGGTGGTGGTGGAGGTMCEPGSQVACYSGPPGTETEGVCQPGQQTCNDEGLGFGECVGEVLPAVETCGTKVDDDCDGSDCASWGVVLPDYIYDISVSSAGEVVIVAGFSGSELAGVNVTGEGPLVVVKINPSGRVLWAKAVGGAAAILNSTAALAIDPQGNIILAGYYQDTINLGGNDHGSVGDEDLFVAKLSSDGEYLWSHSFGGPNSDRILGVASDKLGDIIVAGHFSGTLSMYDEMLTATGESDVVVIKLGSTGGSVVWAKAFGDAATVARVETLALNEKGDPLVAGPYFGSTIDFGGPPLPAATAPGHRVFLAQLSGAEGHHLWSTQISTPAYIELRGAAVESDDTGDLVIGGVAAGAVDFGSGPLDVPGPANGFVAMFGGTSGSLMWQHVFGGAVESTVNAVTVLGDGSVMLTAQTDGAIDFGGGALFSAGGHDLFLAKLDNQGEHVWSRAFGDDDYQGLSWVATNPTDDFVVACFGYGSIDFGSGALATDGATAIARIAP